MSQESDALAVDGRSDGDVMAAVDDDEVFVIADISRDEAYVSIPLDEAASLQDWQ